jgi:tellurite resistance protein TerC
VIDTTQPWVWFSFNAAVITLLLVDNFVISPRGKTVTMRKALGLTAFWVALAVAFNTWIYAALGQGKALEFLTGYLIEQSLSVDNLFVFLLIFAYFKTPAEHQHKILLWGIIGAQVMRAIFILAGVQLLTQFHWLIYIFGAFLVFSGFKLFTEKDKEVHPEKNIFIRVLRKVMPCTTDYSGGKFMVLKEGIRYATPMLIVLIVIETTDLVFAIDSIPAILAITKDPFIVYTSNIFAILGLRAMYFALKGLMDVFHHLHYGLGIILVFVGLKMLTEHFIHIPIGIALGVIGITIMISIGTSLLFPAKTNAH